MMSVCTHEGGFCLNCRYCLVTLISLGYFGGLSQDVGNLLDLFNF